MTATASQPMDVAAVQDAVRKLAVAVRPRSGEFEEACDLPEDVLHTMLDSGLTRMLTLARHGGSEATPAEWFRTLVELATADPAVAWVGALMSLTNAYVSVAGEPDFAEGYFADPLSCYTFGVKGQGTRRPAEGGRVRVSGRWAITSGSTHAKYVGGMCVDEEGIPKPVLVERDAAQVHRTWDSHGMRGTGSHDVEIDTEVAAEQVLDLPVTDPANPHKLTALAAPTGGWAISTTVVATELGIARRAIDEAVAILRERPVQGGEGKEIERPTTIRAIAQAEGRWRTNALAMTAALDALWDTVEPDGSSDDDARCAVHLVGNTAVRDALDTVRRVFELCGTSPMARGHALERCVRDAATLRSHVSVNDYSWEQHGKALLGV